MAGLPLDPLPPASATALGRAGTPAQVPALMTSSGQRRVRIGRRGAAAAALLLAGAALLLVNVVGLGMDYAVPADATPRGLFAGAGDDASLQRQAGEEEMAYLRRLTDTVHARMTHWGSLQHGGHDPVAVWDNWILHTLKYVAPEFKDYEFSDHKRALRRGWGLCTQHASIVFDVLRQQGYEPARINGDYHSVVEVTSKAGRPVILDADMDVVLGYSLAEIRSSPALVRGPYSRARARVNGLGDWTGSQVADWAQMFYAKPPGQMITGDPYPRWTQLEAIVYPLKWLVPGALLLIALVALRPAFARRGEG